MTFLRRFFTVSSTDPDDARRQQLLNILLLGLFIVDLVGIVAGIALPLTSDEAGNALLVPSGVAVLLLLAVLYSIGRFWSGRVASVLLVVLLTVVLTLSDEPIEVIGGRSLLYFVIPITIASVLISPSASFGAAFLISLLLAGIALNIQLVPNVVATLGFFIVALVAWLSARSLEQALRELRVINRELDQRVADRTRELREALVREQAETSKNQAILQSIADGVLVFDSEGRAAVANTAATRLLERPVSRLVGNDIDQLMGSGVPMSEQLKVRTLIKSDAPPASPLNVQWSGKTLSLSVAPVRVGSGEAAGSVAVLRDVTREAEVSRMKSAFVSMVSHELRTPLNAIQGYTEMLQQNVHGPLPEKHRGVVDRIMMNIGRLLNIVGDLLDQAQIEAGNLTIRESLFTPTELVESVQSSIGAMAQNKGLNLVVEIEPDLPASLTGDPHRLYQILSNLTTNAIKYTARGQVTIRFFRPDPDHWAMQVDDTGTGIPLSAEPYIFEPFRQVDDSISRQHGGIGLGLAIVKRLVELMNGEIRLSSRIGRGSTFTVIFPLVTPQPEKEPA